MSDENTYQPPKVWEWKRTAAARSPILTVRSPVRRMRKSYPWASHPLQLYSLGTPNGQKVTIMLEELLALGVTGAEYDAWLIRMVKATSSPAALLK